ncbi:MFS transporter [Jiangella gansuensis]|uniref:MFS transporter n=1 Tax=Jiangella gansuensis TaxID=281473 RepID=UPI0004B9F18E|nr:MFS transporter [Jiangella gansuensis]
MSGGSLLAHRDFRLLLLGQTTSQFGAQVSGVAIPLLAVLTLDASAFEVGLITAASTVAFAVIGLPAGAWLDRLPRRPVLVVSDLARALLLATIPLAAVTGVLTITQLVVVALVSGVCRVFFDVGYQAYVPSVIGRDRVLAGNSAMETMRASGQFVGPGLGGWLVAVAGAANVVLVQAVTFAVSAASIAAIRHREPAITRPAHRTSMRRDIREGLAFVLRHPALRAVAVASALSNLAFALASAVTFVFLARTLGLSPTVIGLVVAGGSVTVMAGAALTPWLARTVGSARIVWLSLLVTGPFTLLLPLAHPGWTAVAFTVAGMAAGELGQIVYAITSLSLRQRLCPDRLLGRVTATMRFLIMAAFPLGALAGGVLGDTLGLRPALWVCGVVVLLAPAPLVLALRRYRDVEDVPDHHHQPPAAA